jgi:predicted O-methyltransferase YrrM
MPLINDPRLQSVLARLHALSDAQTEALAAFEANRRTAGATVSEEDVKAFRRDKLVALDKDKAEFCYRLCRATGARRVVEIGTSFGVSTLYLAAAVRANRAALGGDGIVVATEYEPLKAAQARENFAAAGVADLIDLREGDFRETLKMLPPAIDFVLVDIWIRYARAAIELVSPNLRSGAVVVCDNTQIQRADYADYLAFVRDPARGFTSMTLPFDGGLEFSVFTGRP